MLKESIMACKLYRYSDHKEQILQSLDDSFNVELVQQLASAIDKDSLPLGVGLTDKNSSDWQAERAMNEKMNGDGNNSSQKYETPSTISSPSPSHSSFDRKDMSFEDFDDFDEEPEENGNEQSQNQNTESPEENVSLEAEPEAAPEASPATAPEQEVTESSTVIKKKVVNGATVLYQYNVKGTQLPELNTDVLKGDLNSVQGTDGVTRILIKDRELWIYYSDDINLNDRMEAVIDLLLAKTYSYLQFSRLARKQNAIVFDILGYELEELSSVDQQ